jgi:hypothetical protein
MGCALATAVVALLVLQVTAQFAQPSLGAPASSAIYVITSEQLDVFVGHDGSADMSYQIGITVRPQSTIISGFVIHLPNWHFETSDVSAKLDNKVLQGLKKTGPAENDLQVNLDSANEMSPGQSYAFSLVVNVGAMVLKHPSDPSKARISITPTWWDPNIVQSIQSLKVNLNLPEDLLDQSKVQYSDGAQVGEHGNRLILSWNYTDVPSDQRTELHADIPASAVSHVYDPFWDIQFHFYQNWLYMIVVIVAVVVVAVGIRKALRKPYVKPYLNIEGWGPRKGLGPMEAALLLDLGNDRVAAMFLVDLAMVDAIGVQDKMQIEVKNPEHEGRSSPFLGCIRNGRLDPIATTNFLGALKDEVTGKLEGYDIAETKAHYSGQGPSKWSLLKGAKAPNIDDLLWLMTDPKAKKRFKDAKFEGVPDWTGWTVVS